MKTLGAAALLVIGAAASPAIADNVNREVDIVNRTGVALVAFYGSNVVTGEWEEDILGLDTLEPGARVAINFDDGTGHCMFDFRAEFEDGDVLEAGRINVCEISEYVYH